MRPGDEVVDTDTVSRFVIVKLQPMEVAKMPTDNELRCDLERALEWEPSLDERRIGVSVDGGMVTLTGEVNSYVERWKAERTVERIKGVMGYANELSVHTSADGSDTDIAQAAADALRWNVSVPTDSVKVKVDEGWLILEDGDWFDTLRARRHTFAHLSRQALDIAEDLASYPGAAPTTALLLSLATTFDRLAGVFGTADAVGSAVRGRP